MKNWESRDQPLPVEIKAKEALSTLAPPVPFVTRLPSSWAECQCYPWSLFYCCLTCPVFHVVLHTPSHNSSWTLTFLTSSLHAQGILLCYLLVACPGIHLLHASFLHLVSVHSSLFSQAGILPSLLIFLHIAMDSSYALRKLFLKTEKLFQGPFALHNSLR